jgi:hypothetical protein
MDVKFTDACHIRINGDDIYKSNIDTLMGTYQLKKGNYKKGLANIVKRYCSKILPVMGIVGTLSAVHTQAMKDYEKVLESFDDYKKKVKERYAQEA